MATETAEKVESTIKSVIESLADGAEGFKTIGEKLEDPTLKTYFLEEANKRAEFKQELESLLHAQGAESAKEGGSISGALHRTWGDLKAKLGGGDHTLLETAEQGEDAAKKAYKDALEEPLPGPVIQILSTQYTHIRQSHDYVKAKLGGGDHTLLETAEQGEDAAKKAYKDALEEPLPGPVIQILSTQYTHIRQSHDYVKAARDARK